MQKRYPVLLCGTAFVLLLLSACSGPVKISTTNVSSYTPLQVLQKSTDAMKGLKSSHVELQSTDHAQAMTSATPVAGDAASAPTNISVNVKGVGDQALPYQDQLRLTINDTTHIAQILQGDQVYVQNPQGTWYVLKKSDLQGATTNPFSGVTFDQKSLLALVQHAKITDHGADTLNGEKLRHISAQLDKDALQQLLSTNPQLSGAVSQQNVATVLNNTRSFLATVDVWIDEGKFYVHRTQLQLTLVADTAALNKAVPRIVTTTVDTIVDLSKFNDLVTITPPTHAIPTNNLGTIFSLSGTKA